MEQLSLSHIRNVLIRLEETLIFGLIERSQFRVNSIVYEAGGLGEALGNESLMGYMLREHEKSHARVRRYTSPDEHPFFADLPEPILATMLFESNPLRENDININDRIREVYEQSIVPYTCKAGDDLQYGSSAICDVTLLQALSKRIHYGKFVAESKYQAAPEVFDALIANQDAEGIGKAITNATVEAAVLDRVLRKASTYVRELAAASEDGTYTMQPEAVRDIYKRWIIPLNKEVQVAYLLGYK